MQGRCFTELTCKLGCISQCSLLPSQTSPCHCWKPRHQKKRSQVSFQSVETLCITLQTELGRPACLSGFCKMLIIPLGLVVNENSNPSSLFQLGGEMGDAVRCLCWNSVCLESCTKPCFFKHRRNQEKEEVVSLPFTPNLLWSTPRSKPDCSILPKPHHHQTLQTFFCFCKLCYSLYIFAFLFLLQQQTCSPHPWNNIQPRHCFAEQLNP